MADLLAVEEAVGAGLLFMVAAALLPVVHILVVVRLFSLKQPAVLNAANEIAVEAFVNRKINFPQIFETVRRTMEAHKVVSHPTLEQILEADNWARRTTSI